MACSGTDRAWQKFGKDDPYFGVLSQPRYRRQSISDVDLKSFFQSGQNYVHQMLAMARTRVDAPHHFRRVLDFGCGVGRLSIPLAEFAETVIAVDISPAMLSEAKVNCQKRGITNIEFTESQTLLAASDQKFDLVHTYIVLQHIPTSRGLAIISQLVDLITDHGIGVFHLTYAKANRNIRWISWTKKWVPFAHNMINLLRGRPFSAPMMQMNDYDLNLVLGLLQKVGIEDFHAQFTDHGGYLGVSLYFKKPGHTATLALAA